MNFIRSTHRGKAGSQAGYAATKVTAVFITVVLLTVLLTPAVVYGEEGYPIDTTLVGNEEGAISDGQTGGEGPTGDEDPIEISHDVVFLLDSGNQTIPVISGETLGDAVPALPEGCGTWIETDSEGNSAEGAPEMDSGSLSALTITGPKYFKAVPATLNMYNEPNGEDGIFLVKYLNQDGVIIQTEELKSGDVIEGPTEEAINMIVIPAGERLLHWYETSGDSAAAFNFGTATAQSDMTFAPYLGRSVVVTFYSGGSYVESQTVLSGEKAEEPPKPSRAGYEFEHWYVSGTDENEAFDFSTPLTENIVLAGKWSPLAVEYTVAIWLEKPGYTADFTPTPGSLSQYNYVHSVTLEGLAGDMTNLKINDLPGEIKDLFTGGHDLLKYGTPQSVESRQIQGNGLTVINLYATRTVYTYTFLLTKRSSNESYMTIGGTTYQSNGDSSFQLKLKYEQETSGLWPVQGVDFAEFGTYTRNASGALISQPLALRCWLRGEGMFWKDDANIASIRRILDDSLISEDGQQKEYTVESSWETSSNTRNYRYFVAAYDGQDLEGLTTITDGDEVTYVLMEEYNQTYTSSSMLSAKPIDGLERVPSSEKDGTYSYSFITYYYVTYGPEKGKYITGQEYDIYYEKAMVEVDKIMDFDEWYKKYQEINSQLQEQYQQNCCFFYSRTIHELTFNMMAPEGSNLETIPDGDPEVEYDVPLISYKPDSDPVDSSNEYTFAGWYRDAEYNEVFDWDITMPNGDMIVYAKWEPTDHTVTFLDGRNGKEQWTQGVADGSYALDKNEYWKKGYFVEGKGEFAGWYYNISGIPVKWSWETLVYTDYTLYAAWKTDGFSITYDAGSGSGAVPVDDNIYGIYTSTRVMDGKDLTGPNDAVFYAWEDQATGRVYYPGDIIRIGENGNVTLVAQYVASDSDLVKVIYHYNGGSESNTTQTFNVLKGSTMHLAGAIFTGNDGQQLIGWASSKSATEADYEVGAAYADVNDKLIPVTGELHFYGIWGEAKYTIRFDSGTKGAFETGQEYEVGDIGHGEVWSDIFGTDNSEVPVPTAYPGYEFIGWAPELPLGDSAITSDQIYEAQYAPIAYINIAKASKVYGNNDPVFSASVASSYISASIRSQISDWLEENFAYFTRAAGEDVRKDSYAITLSDEGRSALEAYLAELETYSFKVNDGALTITPRTLIFSANNQTMVAGDAVPKLTYYMHPDSEDLVSGDVLNVYTYLTGSYDTNVADKYADVIAIGFDAKELDALKDNYKVLTTLGTLTVTEADDKTTGETAGDDSGTTGSGGETTDGGTIGGGAIDGGGETIGGGTTGGGGVVVAQVAEAVEMAPNAVPAMQVSAPADAPTVVLPNEQTPQAAFASWALLNLILTIVTGLIMIALLVTYFTRRKDETEDDPDRDENVKKRLGLRMASIVTAAVAVILFILTQDMSLPMTFTDSWTIWHIVITAAAVVLAFFSRKKYEEEALDDARA